MRVGKKQPNGSQSFFATKLEELAHDKRNIDIYEAIRAWCTVIPSISDNADSRITSVILESVGQWQKSKNENEILRCISGFLDIRHFLGGAIRHANEYILERLKRTKEEYNYDYYEDEKMYKVKIVLLVAFALTGAALLLYLLNQGQNKGQKQTSEQDQQGNAPLADQSQSGSGIAIDKGKYVLILVIDASKQAVLQSLRESKKIVPSECQSLYEATKALLIVKKSDFDKNDELSDWFSEDRAVQENESSEYDVYLVKIELSQDVAGFGKNANSAARYDAFRALSQVPAKLGQEIKISPRLPSAAYKNIGVYQ